jgi:hypothetical protein
MLINTMHIYLVLLSRIPAGHAGKLVVSYEAAPTKEAKGAARHKVSQR